MSEVKVNKISPRSGTTVTLGDSGDTIAITSGASLTGFTSTGIDDNATSTAITIDSSENVGIGVTSMTNKLVLPNASYFAMQDTSNLESLAIRANTSNAMEILTGGSVKMTIDSSGNVLVSTTDTTPSENNDASGISLRSNGQVNVSVDGGAGLDINRKTSDGQILRLRKDGTDVGSIGSSPNFNIQRASGAGFNFGTTNISPLNSGSLSDNTIDLGVSSYRWNDLYLGGSIYLGGTGTANALDDYEEGTYTVSAYDFYTGGNQSSTTATGYYTKIGRICHVFFTLNDIDTTGMTSGNEMFFNLPFTIGVTSQGGDIPNIRSLNATITADIIGTSMVSGNSRFNLLKYDYDGNLSATLVSNFNSGASDLTRVNITYMTN